MAKPTTYISASGIQRDVATGLPTGSPSAKAAMLQRRAARLVEREVHACMSSLVSTLAHGAGTVDRRPRVYGGGGLEDSAAQVLHALTWQAMELAAPVPDYEGAARESGWETAPAFMLVLPHGDLDDDGNPPREDSQNGETYNWQGALAHLGNEPHELEVYEHWAISTWLAEKLIAKGERVDTDFAGLNVWARTTTGQAISMDSVIEAITAETGYASGGEA